MKRIFASAVTLFLGGIFCMAALGQTESGRRRKYSDTLNGLQLSVDLDRESCRLADRLVFKLRLKNVGDFPISLYKELVSGGGGFRVEVTDEKREFVLRSVSFAKNFQGRLWIDEAKTLTLRPGESVERTEKVEFYTQALGPPKMREPGSYWFSVLLYQSPVVGGQRDDDWMLEAKPVKFKVCQ